MLPKTHSTFIYAYAGSGTIAGDSLPTHALAVLGAGDAVTVEASEPLRFILVAGQPIAEPIVQYGPFVMTSRAEIEQAFADYQNGAPRAPPRRVGWRLGLPDHAYFALRKWNRDGCVGQGPEHRVIYGILGFKIRPRRYPIAITQHDRRITE